MLTAVFRLYSGQAMNVQIESWPEHVVFGDEVLHDRRDFVMVKLTRFINPGGDCVT
jgi:hypothetical protein